MSRVCQITGKRFQTGNNVSHSKRHTKRRFYPNLMSKRFYLSATEKWITLKVSAAGLRTIDKVGIERALKTAREHGYLKG